MWVYDTPGIFYKTVHDDQIGYILALIGCIKRDIIPIKNTLEFAYLYLQTYYSNLLYNLIKKSILALNFDQFIETLAQKFNFITKQNQYDLDKTYWYFFDLIRTGKIGAIN